MPTSPRSVRAVAALFVPAIVIAAGSVGCSSAPPPEPPSADGNRATLADDARAVTTLPSQVDANTVTFPATEETRALAVGNVIAPASRDAKPYLRRVTARRRVGDTVTVETRNASLTELFKEAHIRQRVSLADPVNFRRSAGTPPAKTSTESNAPSKPMGGVVMPGIHPMDVETSGISGKFDTPWGKFDLEGGGSFDPSQSYLSLEGSVEFEYDYEAWYDPRPTKLRLILDGRLGARVGARMAARGSATATLAKRELGSIPVGVIYFQAGLVPIFIEVGVDFEASAQLKLEGEVEVDASATVDLGLRAGVVYENGDLQGIGQATSSVRSDFWMNGSASLEGSIHPIDTKLGFKLYGLVGPYLALEPEYTVSGLPTNGSFAHAAKASLKLGGDIEAFGYSLGEVSAGIGEWSWPFDPMVVCPAVAELGAVASGGPNGFCKSGELRSKLAGGDMTACVVGTAGSRCVEACQVRDGYDTNCDLRKVLRCQCESLYAGKPNAGTPTMPAGGGDCVARYCAPCAQGSLVCPVPP
ncbi:MAG: hypothetical protein JST00_08720 [Deltaproteobacteria bacterium]|nr:hypothetical protein [Deltaproteobacteria bacterium]